MRIKLLTALVFLLVFSAVPVNAQQKGQYIPGQRGLNAGLLPDPGFTYANLTINYSADTLKNGNGNTVPLTGSYDIWAVANVFYYVPKFKFLGAKLAFMVAPTLANGSLTLGSLRFPNVALNAGGEGLADLWVQPLTLGWSLKRVDVYAGYAFMAPTGRYSAGASDNVGSGYWGNHFITGSTFYITKNKGTTANLFTDWEFHGSSDCHGDKCDARSGVHDGMGSWPGSTVEEGFHQAIAARGNRLRSMASEQQSGLDCAQRTGKRIAVLLGTCHWFSDQLHPSGESSEFLFQVRR